ncbi:MAG: hypothetical protein HYW24_02445 [Candidatus Aenigmarchaeota archaeon]|nr:hypothetical protein [Candidatus Aenigmarchaeota archaeon]
MLNIENFVAYKISLKTLVGYNPITGEVNPNVANIIQRQAEELKLRSRIHPSLVGYAENRLRRKLTTEDYVSAAYHQSLKRDILTHAYRNGIAITGARTYMELSPPMEALIAPKQDAQKRLVTFFNELDVMSQTKYNHQIPKLPNETEFNPDNLTHPVAARIDLSKLDDFQKWYQEALERQKISEISWPREYREFYEFHDSHEPKGELQILEEKLFGKIDIPSQAEEIELVGKTCL